MTILPESRPYSGVVYSTDEEILQEIADCLAVEIADVHCDSASVDIMRRQITAKLEDGRALRVTVVIEQN